jgi:hypothetical protein
MEVIMRFLLFNLAVVAALFYLFSADRSSLDIGNDHREDPLKAIRQQLESLARDVADGRRSADQATPQSVAAEMPEPIAQEPRPRAIDPVSGEPKDQPLLTGSSPAERASADQDVVPAGAQALQAFDNGPQDHGAVGGPVGSLPQVDDPAVARRRAEVLDGAAQSDDRGGDTTVEAGSAMGSEERLRKLYSLAEEMELLYVSKMTR